MTALDCSRFRFTHQAYALLEGEAELGRECLNVLVDMCYEHKDEASARHARTPLPGQLRCASHATIGLTHTRKPDRIPTRRSQLVVVLAGYTQPMASLLAANPGLDNDDGV